jgi:hypothetical protein
MNLLVSTYVVLLLVVLVCVCAIAGATANPKKAAMVAIESNVFISDR